MYYAKYDHQSNFLRLEAADGGKLMELPLNARFRYKGKDTFLPRRKPSSGWTTAF